MKVHYFQRYHGKENVATANTMLLLSRLYSYSSDKFYRFLSKYFSDSFNPEISFNLQERNKNSIPDATITQESFKIVVETKKTSKGFDDEQLLRHLKSFHNEKYKVLLTLAKDFMAETRRNSFNSKLDKLNKKQLSSIDIHNNNQPSPIIHINTTFEEMANAIDELLDDHDYEMQDILNDYLNYCNTDGLILGSDAQKYMRVQLASKSLDYDVKHSIYSDKADRGFRAHKYIGLYTNKSVRAIGEVIACITAVMTDKGVEYKAESGKLTNERKDTIEKTIVDRNHGNVEHRYFFVDKFYETDFRKVSPKAPMGSRIFDLTQILGTNDIPGTKMLAEQLRKYTWS